MKGIGGIQEGTYRGPAVVEIGSAKIALERVLATDLSSLARSLDRKRLTILGKEVFQSLVVDIDCPESRAAFHRPSHFSYAGPGRKLPLLDQDTGSKLIPLQVEGLTSAQFTLDTGSANSLELFTHYWKRNQLLADRQRISSKRSGGIGGQLTFRLATLRSITIAGYELSAVPAGFVLDGNSGSFDTTQSCGNVGMDVLSRFRLIIDYSKNQMHLEAGPDWHSRPFRRDRLGFKVALRDGTVAVVQVSENSPADRAGLKPGQRIARVNGRAVTVATWRQTAEELSTAETGTAVTVVDSDGVELRIVAAEYYLALDVLPVVSRPEGALPRSRLAQRTVPKRRSSRCSEAASFGRVGRAAHQADRTRDRIPFRNGPETRSNRPVEAEPQVENCIATRGTSTHPSWADNHRSEQVRCDHTPSHRRHADAPPYGATNTCNSDFVKNQLTIGRLVSQTQVKVTAGTQPGCLRQPSEGGYFGFLVSALSRRVSDSRDVVTGLSSPLAKGI